MRVFVAVALVMAFALIALAQGVAGTSGVELVDGSAAAAIQVWPSKYTGTW